MHDIWQWHATTAVCPIQLQQFSTSTLHMVCIQLRHRQFRVPLRRSEGASEGASNPKQALSLLLIIPVLLFIAEDQRPQRHQQLWRTEQPAVCDTVITYMRWGDVYNLRSRLLVGKSTLRQSESLYVIPHVSLRLRSVRYCSSIFQIHYMAIQVHIVNRGEKQSSFWLTGAAFSVPDHPHAALG